MESKVVVINITYAPLANTSLHAETFFQMMFVQCINNNYWQIWLYNGKWSMFLHPW